MSYDRVKNMARGAFQDRPAAAIKQSNFQGVNYVDDTELLQPGQVPFAQNVDFGDPIGAATKRKGLQSLFASLGAGAVRGLHYFDRDAGGQLLLAHGVDIYKLTGGETNKLVDTQADWLAGAGTARVTATGELKLPDPTGTFTRPSEAYKDDGTKVSAGTPRFKEAWV
ncbi:MAG: hypothetical protein AB1510_02130 [Bacillota bacterium]